MARRNRIQYPGALYHVTSRGNRRAPIFIDDRDHLIWLDLLAETVAQHGVVAHAFVHMPNHYHLLAETPGANLSDAIYHLNGQYAQRFNKRHQLSGHVFQGRFYAEPIERQGHLLALSRYIALNPVRAELVSCAEDWRWSSYAALYRPFPQGDCVCHDWLLSQFSGGDKNAQIAAYREFVAQGRDQCSPLHERTMQRASRQTGSAVAIREAWESGQYTVREIAERFGVSTRTVQRIMRRPHG
jgi:putative transposase